MNFITSRLPVLKFIGTAAFVHYGFSYYSQVSRQSILTIQDYVTQNIKQKDSFSLIGVLKPRSVKLASKLNKKFIITDNVRQINCLFEGKIGIQFKEGQTAIVTGYCPNINQKNQIIVKDYQTKHSMQGRQWQTKNKVDKNSYGIQSFK